MKKKTIVERKESLVNKQLDENDLLKIEDRTTVTSTCIIIRAVTQTRLYK